MKKIALALLMLCALHAGAETKWNFEGLPDGALPEGWRIEATGQDTPTAVWRSEKDESSPQSPGVLRLVETHHNINQAFNLCWTEATSFLNGEISVYVKGNSGKRDQGGGPIWRVQDRNNYYIARYNPLERNVSIYYVKDGKRIMLGYSGELEAGDGWYHLRITHRDRRIKVFLDGKMTLMVNSGNYIPAVGGVGLWTKSDAASSFDDFTVIPDQVCP